MVDENTPQQTTVITDVKQAISVLDKIQSTFDVWIPSLQQEVQFKEINAKQQKQLLQSMVDSPFFKTNFITTMYNIIKENYIGDNKFNDFTIIDKQVIILKTRIDCNGSIFELQTDQNVDKKINLNDLYVKAQQISGTPDSDTLSIDGINIKLHVGVPTILTEYKLEEELHQNIDVTNINVEGLRKTLGELFIGEVAKYVQKVIIDPNTTIDFTGLSFAKRIQIIEKLPTKLTQKVIDYIDNIKKIIDSISTVTLPVIGTEDVTVEEKIDMDGAFFSLK